MAAFSIFQFNVPGIGWMKYALPEVTCGPQQPLTMGSQAYTANIEPPSSSNSWHQPDRTVHVFAESIQVRIGTVLL
jgi:hypothetical protein